MSIERKMPIDDTYMHVIEFGRGPRAAVILAGSSLCGIEGLGDAVEAAYGCMHDDFHVYCLNTKKVLRPDESVADMASDAARCLGALGVGSADFMGASHGGMIAMTLAVEHPDMVRRLALCGSSPHVAGRAAETIGRWRSLALDRDIRGLADAFFSDLYSKEFQEAHPQLRDALASRGTDADCGHFVTLMDSILSFDIRARLREIKCDTLVLCADDDRVLGVEASRETALGIGCEIHEYAGLGHAFYDETADTPRRIMAHFLRDTIR